jgi:hypothetical protein
MSVNICQFGLLGDHVWKYQTASKCYLAFESEMPYGLVHSCNLFGRTSIFQVDYTLKSSQMKYQVSPFIRVLILERHISQPNTVVHVGKRLCCVKTSAVPWQCHTNVAFAPVFTFVTDCVLLYLLICLFVPASSKVKPTKFLSPMCLSFSNFLFATMLLGQCTESAPMAYPVCN